MAKIEFYDIQGYIYFKKLIIKYFLVLIVGYLIALISTPLFWYKNVYLVHTVMELFCIFIALSAFLIVWHSYEDTNGAFRKLGFGLLAVAIFDSFHTYFWLSPLVSIQLNIDLSVKFWVIGRFVESFIILYLSISGEEKTGSKWEKLFCVLFFTCGLSYMIILNPDILPHMYLKQGLTTSKIFSEYVIIIISLLSLYNLKYKIRGENYNTYSYIFISLLFVIPAELSFTKYNVINGFYVMYGHVLKLVYYYYLFKAGYVCSIEYPYQKLAEACSEQENANARINEISYTLKDTLDALPIGILNYENDSRIKYMNKQLEEILACDRNDFYGLTMKELINAFVLVDDEKTLKRSIYESNYNSESKIINIKNLKNEHIKLSYSTQSIGKGVLVYFYEVKRQQEIEYFHLQTQTILNSVSNTILIIDKKRRIILHNEAFKKILELGDIGIIGMDIEQFNNNIGFKGQSLSEMLIANKTVEQPQAITITTFKGNRIELLNYMSPIVNVEEEIIGAISICTDITEIKKHQHNIQQQEKLALIGQMAAGIVHEIKNPLATIKGLSQLISSKTNMDKIKEYSSVIDSSIDDITNVVNDFLNFAKPKPTVITRTSINKIVSSMQLITETHCYTKNIKNWFHYSSCNMKITADEIKIKQVILNITENAIAALENVEEPELVIRTYYDAVKKEGVISITDNGIGMSPEVVGKLGTPFFTTKEKGTGLGLGISYQIMQEHKGRIEVESEEGKGSVFKIIFTQIEDLL